MIVGNDISNFQGEVDFSTYWKNTNFVFAKASEGVGYIDTWYGNNRTQARANNLPFGSYHFARPDTGNSPEAEAKYFCDLIDGDPIREGEVLALDYEVIYPDAVTWCKTWLDYVSNHFNGIKPLIYMDQSRVTGFDWFPVVNAGYGLWIAGYTYDPNNNNVQTGAWPSAAMQQWTDRQRVPGISGNVDGDVFFGDVTQFKEYGFKAAEPPQPTPMPPVYVPPILPPIDVPPIPSTPPISTSDPVVLPPEEKPTPSVQPVPTSFFSKFILFLKKFFGISQ